MFRFKRSLVGFRDTSISNAAFPTAPIQGCVYGENGRQNIYECPKVDCASSSKGRHSQESRTTTANWSAGLAHSVRDNNVDQALRVLKKKLPQEGVYVTEGNVASSFHSSKKQTSLKQGTQCEGAANRVRVAIARTIVRRLSSNSRGSGPAGADIAGSFRPKRGRVVFEHSVHRPPPTKPARRAGNDRRISKPALSPTDRRGCRR